MTLRTGIYEQLVNLLLREDLFRLDPGRFRTVRENLDPAEAPARRIRMANRILEYLSEEMENPDVLEARLPGKPEMLLSVLDVGEFGGGGPDSPLSRPSGRPFFPLRPGPARRLYPGRDSCGIRAGSRGKDARVPGGCPVSPVPLDRSPVCTLDKSEKRYSPTTMYNDYAVSERLFHWESQSTTRESSPTGQHYIHHERTGNRIFLFVRSNKKAADSPLSLNSPYSFLGPVRYVSHEGNAPMRILFQLDYYLPAHLLRERGKLAVGV